MILKEMFLAKRNRIIVIDSHSYTTNAHSYT